MADPAGLGPIPEGGLSVVVPAYNEERRLGDTVGRILDYCRIRVHEYEVIVVDDGSTDGTSDVAKKAAAGDDRLRVIRLSRNMGKGHAVKTGALQARYGYVLFSDADLSTPIEEIEKLAIHAGPRSLVIASRGKRGAELVKRQPWIRETMGRIFNWMIRRLMQLDIWDTQCGFKLMGRDVAMAVFPRLKTDGFAFDVELLLLAQDEGFDIFEVPVRWYNEEGSKVKTFLDPLVMLKDVVKIKTRLKGRRGGGP